MRRLAVVSRPEPKLLSDREIFKLATRMMDAMKIEDYITRPVLEGWGARDLYPGGRVMQIWRCSENFNIEITLMAIARGDYRVTYVLLEARK